MNALLDSVEIPAGCEPYILAHRSELDLVLRAAYAKTVQQEFAEIEPLLPTRADHVVEIGCGLGALAVLLAWRYPGAALTLIDGDGPAERMTGFGERALTPRNSRVLADELLHRNGVQHARWIEPHAALTINMRASIVISLLSWGFHYPLATYPGIDGGTVIADVRLTKRAEAEARFGPPDVVVRETDKFARMVWQR